MNNDINIPYAVYGTLRTGHGNSRLWRDMADAQGVGTVTGYRLVTNGGFPYALPADELSVIEVVQPRPEHAAEVRYRLDRLEGYPSFYDRVLVDVDLNGETVRCWMYTPVQSESYASLAAVEGNDWNQHVRAYV